MWLFIKLNCFLEKYSGFKQKFALPALKREKAFCFMEIFTRYFDRKCWSGQNKSHFLQKLLRSLGKNCKDQLSLWEQLEVYLSSSELPDQYSSFKGCHAKLTSNEMLIPQSLWGQTFSKLINLTPKFPIIINKISSLNLYTKCNFI